jgi:hypothetical protein
MTDQSLSELSGTDSTLDSYRRGVDAECEALFGEAMRARQRSRVLRRLTEPRVLPFPGAMPVADHRANTSASQTSPSRRWLGLTAAAALMVGLITGQHVPIADLYNAAFPPAVRPQSVPVSTSAVAPRPSTAGGGYLSSVALDRDDALLDAIDVAVSQRGPMELRALDDLTFQYDQR